MAKQDADAAKAALIEAVTVARDMQRRTGQVYADVVRGVIKCLDAAMSRAAISSTIATAWAGQQRTASKGIGARYIILARYQRKEWLPGERHPRSAITVGQNAYPSPLDALDAGEGFTETYRAWTNAVKARVASHVAPQSPIVAARHMVSRMFVVVQRGDTQARLKVEEDPVAFVGVVSALMATPPAVQLIPGQTRAALARALKRVRRVA